VHKNYGENNRTQRLETELQTKLSLVADLGKTIVNQEARDYLLRAVLNALDDVKTVLLPNSRKAATPAHTSMWLDAAEWQLRSAGEGLKRASEFVKTYGPNLRVIG
jgi:hypothetical protein